MATTRHQKLNKQNESKNVTCSAAGLLTTTNNENCLFCNSTMHLTVNCNSDMSIADKGIY